MNIIGSRRLGNIYVFMQGKWQKIYLFLINTVQVIFEAPNFNDNLYVAMLTLCQ